MMPASDGGPPLQKLREIEKPDLPQVLRLNNAAVPAVNQLELPALEELLEQAEVAIAVAAGASIKGFLLAFGPGAPYRSPNYRWFGARYQDFLYIDRIVVSPAARGGGIGRQLYRATFAEAQARPLACEVNLRPLNEHSLLFHQSLGFQQVGEESLPDGKVVAMLATRPLESDLCSRSPSTGTTAAAAH